jgi:uncharacterized membrane protein YbhN (UPF0104 family)
MSGRLWGWARLAGGAAFLAVLLWRLGTTPVLDGLRSIDVRSVLAAAGIAVITTACAAWRWRLVARGLGVGMSLPGAIAAYYRSQFLNTVLPGGVLGDVHRGVSHGRDVDDVSRGLRAVGWERFAGQVVQVVLALVVLAACPSPVRRYLPLILVVVTAVAVGAVVLVRTLPSRWARTVRDDLRSGLLARGSWPGITVASAVIVTGHAATFLIAARTAGSTASLAQLLPLTMLVLLAMTVPTSIGGWGPREGAAAALFGAAGLGAGNGLAAATVFGVLVLAATAPGAVVLVVSWLRHSLPTAAAPSPARPRDAAAPPRPLPTARPEGAVHG